MLRGIQTVDLWTQEVSLAWQFEYLGCHKARSLGGPQKVVADGGENIARRALVVSHVACARTQCRSVGMPGPVLRSRIFGFAAPASIAQKEPLQSSGCVCVCVRWWAPSVALLFAYFVPSLVLRACLPACLLN